MKKVPVLNFPNPATAVIKLPNARLARLLGDYFNTHKTKDDFYGKNNEENKK